ncbi:MAG: ATP synthase F1 subunit delta [Bacteroidetes bacterium]|nr:ATP synthase F1 subunit delta [Bacteroidota bacterium]MBS1540175.1 ATP synthase F1 subunit delta [Bacteroidota bacterium]
MADSRVAARYVKSLLGLAIEQNVLEQVHTDMQLLDNLCRTNRDLLMMLRSPIIKHDKKRQILEILFKGKVSTLTTSIIDILTRKNREPLLPAIAAEFGNAYNEYKGIQKAVVTTTVAVDENLRKEIEAIVKKLSNKKQVTLETKVDKELIGGFILNVGDRQIDASIKNKLKSLQVRFNENPYAKQL